MGSSLTTYGNVIYNTIYYPEGYTTYQNIEIKDKYVDNEYIIRERWDRYYNKGQYGEVIAEITLSSQMTPGEAIKEEEEAWMSRRLDIIRKVKGSKN
ncbi:MAG: hypothetical protein F6K22_13730 [Okeania sp. SIO2F4]|uniref:hypothetical protein n=1 Tax=Okeania sp. SIO2F4 TaxID=2607790 RepID=UPI00142B80B9|nr:hypothetical protein [Okeania sp. SIO2F4]NES03805.1 hypothetical protein [Okeania sp. SIO2F4]